MYFGGLDFSTIANEVGDVVHCKFEQSVVKDDKGIITIK
jgi:hypothetical protein